MDITDNTGDKRLEKLARIRVTNRYGYYTFGITLLFVLLLPYWSRSNFHVNSSSLRKLKLRLFQYRVSRINPSTLQMALFWSIVLLILSLSETKSDLTWIAARLGRVCVYCLPTVFFLTLRPSPLPDTLYLNLIPIHKWLARLAVLQGILHGTYYCYLGFYYNDVKRIFRKDNFLGVIATIAFILIAITSISQVRRAAFNVFYINHYICSWVVVIALQGHARPGIPMVTTLNCSILLYQLFNRFRLSSITWINAYQVSKHMTIVEIPNDAIKNKSGLPGCHIRMIEYDERNPFKQLWKNLIAPVQHPYTLASLPVDETQKLIVRTGKFKLNSTKRYVVTGAFLPFLKFLKPMPNSPIEMLSFRTKVKKCFLVAGGSAISFVLPIARALNYNGAMVKILWVIRDHEDLKVLDYFKKTIISDDMIDIFITGNYTNREKKEFTMVLNDLRKSRRQHEFAKENEILTGKYDYASSDYNDQLEVDFSNFGKSSTTNETSPLNGSLEHAKSYDSVNGTVELPRGFQNFPPMKKRRSYVDIRAHQNLGEFDENNNNEETMDIDVELDVSGKYNSRVQSTVTYSASEDNVNQKPGAGFSDNISSPCLQPPTAKGKAVATQSLDTGTSSALYDDLLDYWVLGNTSCKVSFGRPKLGLDYYSWCIGSSCIGPMVCLQTGESICYSQDPHIVELYTNGTFLANRQARMEERGGKPDETIWVVAAGPQGLVNNSRLWANDCGFNFHEESFSV